MFVHAMYTIMYVLHIFVFNDDALLSHYFDQGLTNGLTAYTCCICINSVFF